MHTRGGCSAGCFLLVVIAHASCVRLYALWSGETPRFLMGANPLQLVSIIFTFPLLLTDRQN